MNQLIPARGKNAASLQQEEDGLNGDVFATGRASENGHLISRFEWLRARPKHEVSTPAMYMVFDLVELKGDDLRARPLHERRQELEQLVGRHQFIIRRDDPLPIAQRRGRSAALQLRG